MRIAGFSRAGKLEPLPAAVVLVLLLLGPGISLVLKLLGGGDDISPVSILLVVAGVWFGAVGLFWLWKAFMENCAIQAGTGLLRVNMLFGRTIKLREIRAIGWGETVARRRSYVTLRLHLVSGEDYDIPVAFIDGHPDEILRRIQALCEA